MSGQARTARDTAAQTRPVIRETRAKQGRTGSHALTILLTSLALALMAALLLGLI